MDALMDALEEVRDEMKAIGWDAGVKRDGDGVAIAQAHGAEWISDMHLAMARVQARAAARELERRAEAGEL